MENQSAEPPLGRTRRSPRTCVRKIKISSTDNDRCVQTEARKLRKRKTVSFEEVSASGSDFEHEEDIRDQQKKVPGYRCSPHLVPELMDELSLTQTGWVRNIHFGPLQNMIDSRCPKSLTMWLVNKVDTGKGTLEVCGLSLDIKKGVERILQLPSGGSKVPQPLNGRSKAKRPRSSSSRNDDKHSENGRGQTAKEARKIVLDEKENEVEFIRSFVMYVLCIYLAPATSLNINRGFFPALIDISKIHLMDWCAFIADYLIRGIEESRRSKASHVQVSGCVHILPLMYIDDLIQTGALTLPEALSLPQDLPRIHFIGTEHLDFLAAADIKSKSKDRIEYGLLQGNIRSTRPAVNSPPKHTDASAPAPNVSFDQGPKTYKPVPLEAENNEATFLDSLFAEIREARSHVVKEFDIRLQHFEDEICARFKQKYKQKFTSSNVEKDPGCTSTTHIRGTEAACNGEQNSREESPSTPIPPPVHSPAPDSNDVPNNLQHDLPSSAPPPTGNTWTDGEPQHPDQSQPAGAARQPDDTFKTVEFPIDEPAPHEVESEPNPDRFFDELQQVVSIAIEAAHQATSDAGDADISLNLLSDIAIQEATPMFDNSPAVIMDGQFGPNLNASSSSGSAPPSNLSKRPVFYQSPVTPATSSFYAQGKTQALRPIPESSNLLHEIGTATAAGMSHNADEVGQISPDFNPFTSGQYGPINTEASSEDSDETTLAASPPQSQNSNPSVSTESESSQEILSDAGADLMNSTQDFILTPSYTYDTQDIIELPDDPQSPPPGDVIAIPPLQQEIQSGYRFRFGGYISLATEKMVETLSSTEVLDTASFKFIFCKDAMDTYKEHVTNSDAKGTSRRLNVVNQNRSRTKIQIDGFHISNGDFVDALKPNGEVSLTFMGLCCKAIMLDWESSKRIILDPAIIRELIKPGHVCVQKILAAKLRKHNLQDIEEIFIPILRNNHWILIILDMVNEIADFYDSTTRLSDEYNPHHDIWINLSGNLEESYSLAKKKTISITFFRRRFPECRKQTNNHDCGFHVIHTLECHKTKDIFKGTKNKTMLNYRKYLSHLLIHHRFNDLNPLREDLVGELP